MKNTNAFHTNFKNIFMTPATTFYLLPACYNDACVVTFKVFFVQSPEQHHFSHFLGFCFSQQDKVLSSACLSLDLAMSIYVKIIWSHFLQIVSFNTYEVLEYNMIKGLKYQPVFYLLHIVRCFCDNIGNSFNGQTDI